MSTVPGDGFGRPSGQDEVHRFAALLADAFGMNPADVPAALANAGNENIRLQREHGEIAGGLNFVHHGQFWGGRSVKMGGIAGVATAPHLRGMGTATRLMQSALRELRSLGYPLSALYASTQRLYRRVGYEQAGVRAELRGPVRELPSGERELPVRPLRLGDEDAVEALYAQVARTRNGWLDRGPYVWNRVANPRGTTTHAYLFGHGAKLEGYLFLGKTRPASGGVLYELKISDLQFRTERAARRILTFLADDASMASELSWFTAPDHPLQLLLPEQSIRVRVADVWMLRILDVPGALQARGWPQGVRGELHLELEDELLPDNAGRWVLDVSGGEAHVRRGGEGHLRCNIRALASLYSGGRSASELASLGLVSETASAIEVADALFAARAPSMPDSF
ncbi:MAG: GNAT family N-acetyltransferase [Myxococcaceae bacterium]